MRAQAFWGLFLLTFLLSGNALAANRLAVVVGANKGSTADLPLQYAEEDARRVGAVLTELGGFAAEDVAILNGPDDKRLFEKLDEVGKKLAGAPAEGSLFVFYYSGHGDAEQLHLGGTSVPLDKLYHRLRQLPAKVKVGIIDACRSGSILATKAGRRGTSFGVSMTDELNATSSEVSGTVFLTSSGEDELSIEVRALKGSFFTNHLVSGLRGVADSNGDKQVSLEEVYTYAYEQTVRDTIDAPAGAQHPSYKKELKGHGNLYLAALPARSRLQFPSGSQRCYVTSSDELQLVAEVMARQQRSTELALPPGNYLLKCREDTTLKVASFRVKAGEAVDTTQLSFNQQKPFSEGVLKGALGRLDKLTAINLMRDARQILTSDPQNMDRGVLLAVQSLKVNPSPEAHQVLVQGLEQLPRSKLCFSHDAPVLAAAWSPDGERLATVTSGNVVRVWSLKTRETLAELSLDGKVKELAWRKDGTRLTLRDPESRVMYWDVKPGQRDSHTQKESALYAVALDPTGVHEALMDPGEALLLRRQSDGVGVLRESSMRPTARFSANGRFLAAMSISGRARVWEVGTSWKEEVAVKPFESSSKAMLAIGPDSRFLALGQEGERTVQVWDVPGARQTSPLNHDGPVTALAFASTISLLTASEDKTVRLWESTTGHELRRLSHEAAVNSMAVSLDGQWLATTWQEGSAAALWNLRTGIQTRLSHGGAVTAVAWSPREERVATASEDGTACVWEVPKAEVARVTSLGQHTGMVFARGGRLLVIAKAAEPTCILDASTGNKLACLNDSEGAHLLTVSPDGKRLATASGTLARVWDASSSKEVSRMQHEGFIHALEFSPDGARMASASRDGTVRLWDATTGRALPWGMKHEGPVKTVAFSGDGKRLATGGEDTTARVWDVETGKELLKLAHPALSCDEPIGVAQESCEQPHMAGTPAAVESVRLSPDGRRLATATLDGVVRLWDTQSGRLVLDQPQATRIRSMVFTPDGQGLAIANSEPVVSIWEAETGRDLPSVEAQESISFLEYSQDEKYLLTLSEKGTVSVWEAGSRVEISRTLEGVSTHPPLLSPDGQFLATVHDPGTGRGLTYSIHSWRTEDLIKKACERLERNLSQEEWNSHVLEKNYEKTCANLP
ncbi:caspase family protein [Hyalangium gracile]|uniref:caspase family protein n=1 Tax=Hyalangium gracile TaxID=394092 RepID=UPI001CCD84D8|nr:caspase family protein [Hyalangium gracile]